MSDETKSKSQNEEVNTSASEDAKSELQETVDTKSQQPDTVSSLEELYQEPTADSKQKEYAVKKAREKIVNNFVEKVATGEIAIEDVDEWVRDDVAKQFAEIKEPDRVSKLESEVEQLKKSSLKSESTKLFEDTLSRNGLTREEFSKKYWNKYVEEFQKWKGKGLTEVDATEASLNAIGISYHISITEAEKRGKQEAGFRIPTEARNGIAEEVYDEDAAYQKEVAACQQFGMTPPTKEAFQKARKSGIY
jgi:hypothetical protein